MIVIRVMINPTKTLFLELKFKKNLAPILSVKILHIRTLSLARSMTSRSLCKLFIISTPICSKTERDAHKLTGFFQNFTTLASIQENSLSGEVYHCNHVVSLV